MSNKLSQAISKLSRNRDAKVVASNFAWLSALQVAGYVFPLITMPYLARVIGVDGFGKIAFANAIILWIQIISEWGFNQTATRDVAQNRDNHQAVSQIFSNVLWARCLLMFFSLAVLLGLIAVIPQFREYWAVILVTFLMIPGHILFPDWFFQAIEKMRYISLFNIGMKFLFTIAVFVFIKAPEDYILQPLFISLGYMVSGCIAFYFIVWRWQVKILPPKCSEVFSAIKQSTDVFINNLAPNLYNSFSQLLLGFMGGATANGFYEGGNKLYTISSNLLRVLIRAFFPFLSRKPEKHRIFVFVTMGITAVAVLGLIVLAPYLIRFVLSEEFLDSVVVLRILAVSLFFVMLYNCYGMCYLIIHKQEKKLRQITMYVSIFGLVISWWFIKEYSYLGAAITVALCRALLGVITFVVAKKHQLADCKKS